MSEWHPHVVKIGNVDKHPQADRLEITHVYGYPVIMQSGSYKEGDLAAYIPVDTLVPLSNPVFEFLKKQNKDRERARIKAIKLRGVFSQGLLVPIQEGWEKDRDVTKDFDLEKYEPPIPISMGGETERAPTIFAKYTDIEGLKRYSDIFQENEQVQITEKIHGANGRWVYHEGRIWVGSHNQCLKPSGNSVWMRVAEQYNLEEKLSDYPDMVLFGEVYGCVQSLKYGHSGGKVSLACFDVLDTKTGTFYDVDELSRFLVDTKLPNVPCLYTGVWDRKLADELSNGRSTVLGADNVREGVVIKPLRERWDDRTGRVILKLVGEIYMLKN